MPTRRRRRSRPTGPRRTPAPARPCSAPGAPPRHSATTTSRSTWRPATRRPSWAGRSRWRSLAGVRRRPTPSIRWRRSGRQTGVLADAVDAARRGLELAEGRERRRMLERLIARLRASEPGEPGRLALERALLVLEGTAMTATALPPAEAGVEPDEEPAPGGDPGAEAVDVEETPARARAALDRDLSSDASPEELTWLVEVALDEAGSGRRGGAPAGPCGRRPPARSCQCRHGRLLRRPLAGT